MMKATTGLRETTVIALREFVKRQNILPIRIDCFLDESRFRKTRDSFLANLTSVPIVEITEDMANAERAEIYLSERARITK